jgi:hypothetical protein
LFPSLVPFAVAIPASLPRIASHEAIPIAYKVSKWRACDLAVNSKQRLILQCGADETVLTSPGAVAL